MSEHEAGPHSTPIVRKHLLSAPIAGRRELGRVEIRQIDLQPGQETGLHLHPIPVVGYIARGTIRFQLEGGPLLMLPAGSAFFEPADTGVLHFDNASTEEAATFIAYYLLSEGDEQLIEMLE
ncbi:MAG: cupin domain-containing protein [Steroidobacteraceae bacterium]